MNEDEIDTIFLIEIAITDTLVTRQFYSKITYKWTDKQEETLKFVKS